MRFLEGAAGLALLLAANAPVVRATEAEPAASRAVRTLDDVPDGSPEDRELWRSGREVQTRSIVEQERTRRLMNTLRGAGITSKLAAAEGARDAGDERRAASLSKALAETAQAAYAAAATPPFNLRTGCRYKLLHLRQAMTAKAGTPGAASLPAARADMTRCRDALRSWLEPLKAANDRFEPALREAEAFVAAQKREPVKTRAAAAPEPPAPKAEP